MNTPQHQIPPARRWTYYAGLGLMIIGLLLFFSVFVTGALHFGDFSNFHGQVRSAVFRALGGMCLLIVGSILRAVGARGLAGSGVVLDPEQARKDVEPWSRLAGGVTDDLLSEVGLARKLDQKLGESAPPPPVVKVRCPKCGALNDEDAKFCKQCGAGL